VLRSSIYQRFFNLFPMESHHKHKKKRFSFSGEVQDIRTIPPFLFGNVLMSFTSPEKDFLFIFMM